MWNVPMQEYPSVYIYIDKRRSQMCSASGEAHLLPRIEALVSYRRKYQIKWKTVRVLLFSELEACQLAVMKRFNRERLVNWLYFATIVLKIDWSDDVTSIIEVFLDFFICNGHITGLFLSHESYFWGAWAQREYINGIELNFIVRFVALIHHAQHGFFIETDMQSFPQWSQDIIAARVISLTSVIYVFTAVRVCWLTSVSRQAGRWLESVTWCWDRSNVQTLGLDGNGAHPLDTYTRQTISWLK